MVFLTWRTTYLAMVVALKCLRLKNISIERAWESLTGQIIRLWKTNKIWKRYWHLKQLEVFAKCEWDRFVKAHRAQTDETLETITQEALQEKLMFVKNKEEWKEIGDDIVWRSLRCFLNMWCYIVWVGTPSYILPPMILVRNISLTMWLKLFHVSLM